MHPYRPSSCRASAASSPDSTFSSSPGCSSQGLGRATTSSYYGLVARGHVCPKRSSARAWFLPTSHSLELWSLPHLVIRWGRCFSPQLVTQHMACHSLGGKELERFAWDVKLSCWRPSQPCPQHPSSYAFATLFYFLLLTPSLAGQGCSFLSVTAARLLSQPKLGWCVCTPCLSPALMLQVRQHQHKLLFFPYPFSFWIFAIEVAGPGTMVTRSKLFILAFLLHRLIFSSTIRC